MNVFNRIFLALYSLIWMAACGGLIVLAWNDEQKLDIVAGDFNLQAFIQSGDSERWLFTALMGLLALIGVITLVTAFTRSRQGSKGTVRLKAADGGMVEVDASAVEALLRNELEALPNVRQALPVVRASNGPVETNITVAVYPGAIITDVTAAVRDTTALVLREQVGATQLKRPVIHVTYDDLAVRPAARPAPIFPAAAAPAPPPPPPAARAEGSHPASDALPPPPPPPGAVIGSHPTERVRWDADAAATRHADTADDGPEIGATSDDDSSEVKRD